MTKAHDMALDILQKRGMNLTKEDVEDIKLLSAAFSAEEADNSLRLFESIEQIMMDPDSNFNDGDEKGVLSMGDGALTL